RPTYESRKPGMKTYTHFYIDGRWQAPAGSETIDVHSSATEELIGRVPKGTPDDVDRAVKAARGAFASAWSQTEPAERAQWLERLADALEKRVPEIASTISQ